MQMCKYLTYAATLIILLVSISSCSNSQDTNEFVDNIEFEVYESNQTASKDTSSCTTDISSSSIAPANLVFDDSQYPYAGIPRIVIETENFQQVKDREKEIPAKLQIWGKDKPITEIMNLTIKGRGNTTWTYPKKPYTIKFDNKKSILGMRSAKKWTMLANYRDRTLIRNALAFEIARKTSLEWTPSGQFADVFFNQKFIGNYYICEKIQDKKNRLNLSDEGFLLEIDDHYDEPYKFKTSINNLPVNIHHPDTVSITQLDYLKNYLDTLENIIEKNFKDLDISQYLNLQSLAAFWITYEIAQNGTMNTPRSIFVYKEKGETVTFGPVWDFDWDTFNIKKKGFILKNAFWLKRLIKERNFVDIVQAEWNSHKKEFETLSNVIDSLYQYTKKSNENNINLWPIKINDSGIIGDEKKTLDEAFGMLKLAYESRIKELDALFNTLEKTY